LGDEVVRAAVAEFGIKERREGLRSVKLRNLDVKVLRHPRSRDDSLVHSSSNTTLTVVLDWCVEIIEEAEVDWLVRGGSLRSVRFRTKAIEGIEEIRI
jgi:hypothetical protein